MFIASQKKPEITDDEFFHYWKNVLGPISRKIPGLRKLVQSHTIRVPRVVRYPDFDGMAELWFDGMDDLIAARKSPEWHASVNDEPNLIDHTKVAYFISQEHEIRPSPTK